MGHHAGVHFLCPVQAFAGNAVERPAQEQKFQPAQKCRIGDFRGFEFAPCVLFPEGNVVQTENHPAPGPAFDLCERNGIYALDDDAIYALLLERPAKEIDVRRFFRIGSGRQLPELKYCPLFIT